MKKVTVRDRPWWFYEHEHAAGRQLNVIVLTGDRGPLKSHGFLSGHTATTFSLATALAIVNRKRREKRLVVASMWTAAVLIMFSRVYIVDHWPLDCVAGAVLGVASGFLAVKFCRWWASRKMTPTGEPAVVIQHG